jgi:tripartite-type tricarboxylate transporter receptor subunit TctC
VTQWHGLLAPRGTPRPIINRVQQEIAKAASLPDIASRFAQDGTEAIASTPQEFAAFLKSERDRWSRVAKVANIRNE